MRGEPRAADLNVPGYVFTCWAPDLESTILMIAKDPERHVEPGQWGTVVGVGAEFLVTSVSPNQAFVTALARTPFGVFMDEQGILRSHRDVVIHTKPSGR